MKSIAGTKVVRMTRIRGKGGDAERESQLRVMGALETLGATRRGQAVLDDLALIFNGQAKGLDFSGMSALVCLMREFAFGGRRGFLLPRKSTRMTTKLNKGQIKFQVYRENKPYRQVFAFNAGDACDIVRADDSNAGEFLVVEAYQAAQVAEKGMQEDES